MELFKYCLIGLTVLFFLVFLALVCAGKKKNSNGGFFSDILKESDGDRVKWSQGRFYLFLSLLFYFFVLTLLSIKAVRPNAEIKNESIDMVISALQWIIALFAGYVFGAKGLKVLDSVIKYRSSAKNQPSETTSQTVSPAAEPTSNTNPKEIQP
jgi:hypothetical protein